MADGVVYIKIAKTDKNGINQTNTLQSLNQVIIPYSSGDIAYKVISITEHPTFFLYYVNPAGVEWADRAEIKYDFTGSILNSSKRYQTTQDMSGAPDLYIKFPIISSSNDNLNFLNLGPSTNFDNNNSLNTYRLLTYPQETLQIDFSGSVMFEPFTSGFGVSSEVALVLLKKDGVEPILLQSSPYSIPSSKQSFTLNKTLPITSSFHISASLSSSLQPGDSLFAALGAFPTSGNEQVTASFTSDTTFTISSPNATGQQVGLVPEPYFGSNDFKRALDCQPLLNNVDTNRRHNLYQDVDYSAGINEPTNFDLLISGSALRAEVQLSNYTTRRHVIPRYEGSKTTSQKLNKWSKKDTGTFGKTPTVESLKTVIAYCDWIGGWPPDRMNASTAHILYLIDADGNIGVPNTSENSLPNVQGAFQTGEKFRISSKTIGSGPKTQFRNVIRGGQRIEPILSTQSGSAPNAEWVDINLQDIQPTSGGATGNYQNTGYANSQLATYTFAQRLSLNPNTQGSSYINNSTIFGLNYSYYQVPSNAVDDGISLNFQLWGLKLGFFTNITEITKFRVGVILKIESPAPTGGNTSFAVNQQDFAFLQKSGDQRFVTLDTINFNVPSSILKSTQQISFEVVIDELEGELGQTGGANEGVNIQFSSYNITQTPIPTSTISPAAPPSTISNIWGFYDKVNHPNVITSSNDTSVVDGLGGLWRNPNVKQTDVVNSGLQPFSLPWSIEIGDEFRFEGDERYKYMVGKVYGPDEGSGSRLTPTGSIEVQFDGNLPVGADFSSFNLDHFLIRRYIDDPSQIIFEGFRPLNSQGPYILTPEFSTAKLNTDIDDVITNLKERGLITGEEGS